MMKMNSPSLSLCLVVMIPLKIKMNFPLLVTWSIATIYHDVIDCLIPIIEVLIEHWNQVRLTKSSPNKSPRNILSNFILLAYCY